MARVRPYIIYACLCEALWCAELVCESECVLVPPPLLLLMLCATVVYPCHAVYFALNDSSFFIIVGSVRMSSCPTYVVPLSRCCHISSHHIIRHILTVYVERSVRKGCFKVYYVVVVVRLHAHSFGEFIIQFIISFGARSMQKRVHGPGPTVYSVKI